MTRTETQALASRVVNDRLRRFCAGSGLIIGTDAEPNNPFAQRLAFLQARANSIPPSPSTPAWLASPLN